MGIKFPYRIKHDIHWGGVQNCKDAGGVIRYSKERCTDLRELKMLDTSFTRYLQTNKVGIGDLPQVSEWCNWVIDSFG